MVSFQFYLIKNLFTYLHSTYFSRIKGEVFALPIKMNALEDKNPKGWCWNTGCKKFDSFLTSWKSSRFLSLIQIARTCLLWIAKRNKKQDTFYYIRNKHSSYNFYFNGKNFSNSNFFFTSLHKSLQTP